MARPTLRAKRLIGAVVAGGALFGSAAIVWQASYSAFTSKTSNPTNNWAAGSVVLSDDDSNAAMFNATGMKPGATGTKCIAVTSTGTLPSSVKLYGTSYATTNALGANIALTVTQGTGGGFSSGCSGFTPLGTGSSVYSGTLDAFGTSALAYGTGVGSWAPTGSASETRVFQFSYTFSSTAPDTTQGGTASIGFTWEAQNT